MGTPSGPVCSHCQSSVRVAHPSSALSPLAWAIVTRDPSISTSPSPSLASYEKLRGAAGSHTVFAGTGTGGTPGDPGSPEGATTAAGGVVGAAATGWVDGCGVGAGGAGVVATAGAVVATPSREPTAGAGVVAAVEGRRRERGSWLGWLASARQNGENACCKWGGIA